MATRKKTKVKSRPCRTDEIRMDGYDKIEKALWKGPLGIAAIEKVTKIPRHFLSEDLVVLRAARRIVKVGGRKMATYDLPPQADVSA